MKSLADTVKPGGIHTRNLVPRSHHAHDEEADSRERETRPRRPPSSELPPLREKLSHLEEERSKARFASSRNALTPSPADADVCAPSQSVSSEKRGAGDSFSRDTGSGEPISEGPSVRYARQVSITQPELGQAGQNSSPRPRESKPDSKKVPQFFSARSYSFRPPPGRQESILVGTEGMIPPQQKGDSPARTIHESRRDSLTPRSGVVEKGPSDTHSSKKRLGSTNVLSRISATAIGVIEGASLRLKKDDPELSEELKIAAEQLWEQLKQA